MEPNYMWKLRTDGTHVLELADGLFRLETTTNGEYFHWIIWVQNNEGFLRIKDSPQSYNQEHAARRAALHWAQSVFNYAARQTRAALNREG